MKTEFSSPSGQWHLLTLTPQEWLVEILFPLLGTVGLYLLLSFVTKKFLRLAVTDEKSRNSYFSHLRLALRGVAFLVISMIVIRKVLPFRIDRYLLLFLSFLREPFFVSGRTKISIITILLLIPVIYVSAWTGRFLKRTLALTLFSQVRISDERKFSLINLLRYLAMTLTFLFGVTLIGIDLTSVGVVFGFLGLGLGFGLKGVVENFFAGLIIISSRPVCEGDLVRVDGVDGTVSSIRLFNTIISTVMHENIIIPNAQLLGNTVHNYSYDDGHLIVGTKVQVSYSSDLDEVLAILERVGEELPHRLISRGPMARVQSFDDSGITVRLFVWIARLQDRYIARSEMNLAIWRAFRDEGIEIPFPQRVLHLKEREKSPQEESEEDQEHLDSPKSP